MFCSMQTLIAQPQLGESFRCSTNGLSSASHPSRLLLHRKQVVLSGLDEVGQYKKPASASYAEVSNMVWNQSFRHTRAGNGFW